MTRKLRIGITGATGYIGRRLIRRLPLGWSCVSIGRRKPVSSGADAEHRFSDLTKQPETALLDGLDGVVHLAAHVQGDTCSNDAEVAFAVRLADMARINRIPMVFISSQAASPNAPTQYGRTKWAIEQAILPFGALCIRPGQVYGGEESGLFGALCALVRRMPVLPRLVPAPRVQPIHIDDLALGIFHALPIAAEGGGLLCLGSEAIAFDTFLKAIARDRIGARRIMLPVPVPLLRFLLQMVGMISNGKLDATRLDSLTKLPMMQAQADLRRVSVMPRDLRDGMSKSGSSRRRLLHEGQSLAVAVTGARRIPGSVMRHYLRALNTLGQTSALSIPAVLLDVPIFMGALDRPNTRKDAQLGSVAGRLEIISRLCESDRSLAPLYIAKQSDPSPIRAMYDMVVASLREARALLLYPLASWIARSRE